MFSRPPVYQQPIQPFYEGEEGSEPEFEEEELELSPASTTSSASKSTVPSTVAPMTAAMKPALATKPGPVSEFPLPQSQITEMDEEKLKRLGKKECEEAGRIFAKGKVKKDGSRGKSSCRKRAVSRSLQRDECESEGLIYRKATRDANGKVIRKATCVKPKAKADPQSKELFAQYDDDDIDTINRYKSICESANKRFRGQYTTKKNNKFVPGKCVKKNKPKSKSPPKSKSKSPSKSKSKSPSKSKSKSPCPKGQIRRKSYTIEKTGKRVKSACVKKGNRGRSPVNKPKPKSKSPICPRNKSPRKGYTRKDTGTKVKSTCVKKQKK